MFYKKILEYNFTLKIKLPTNISVLVETDLKRAEYFNVTVLEK